MNRYTIDRFLTGTILLAVLCFAARPAFSEGEITFRCYAKFKCNTTNTTFHVPGTGSTEALAKANALQNANDQRNLCISPPNMHSATAVEHEPPCEGPFLRVPLESTAPAPAVKAASASADIMLVHSCYTKNGNRPSELIYGPRENLDALSDLAWNRLAVTAAGDGGMVPGTGQTRIQDMYYYFAYRTVRSTKGKLHRELTLEGRGETQADAQKAVEQAVEKVIDQFASIGETAQTVGPLHEVSVMQGDHDIVTQYCVYRCKTADGWTVIATDFALSQPVACAKASTAANSIANNHGGAVLCEEIEPHEQP